MLWVRFNLELLELRKVGRASTFFDTLFRVALGFFERTAVHFHVLVSQFLIMFLRSFGSIS